MPGIDIEDLRRIAEQKNRYEYQINRLTASNKQTSCIEEAVSKAAKNIEAGTRSFVIYGEPQSGKTEMMICLTAKLADAGHRIIIHLLNDSVQLLQQNLDRFQRSRLSPAAKNFADILDPDFSLKSGHHIIFCKKNASDLTKLLTKTKSLPNKVIIDDEADFATPNALINKGDITAINRLIKDLIGSNGIYIGVTATPARLDLNNTFDNDNEQWVNFPPHNAYTGQDIFFPIDAPVAYPSDADGETKRFIRYWFDDYSRLQLAALAQVIGRVRIKKQRDVLWCAFSRLIIAKERGASLAMDLSHSRPHRSFDRAPAKPFANFLSAVEHVVKNCVSATQKERGPAANTLLGDARRIALKSNSIDLVLTSPPYLNAIDYMRCSKFSLIWMGKSVSELRETRSVSIGTEAANRNLIEKDYIREIINRVRLKPKLSARNRAMLSRYVQDSRMRREVVLTFTK